TGTISTSTTEAIPDAGSEESVMVASGVTVEATAGDVNLSAADSVIVQAGGTVKSDVGAVNIAIGVGDTDNDAAFTNNGSLIQAITRTATTIAFVTAPQALTLGAPARFLVQLQDGSGNPAPAGAGGVIINLATTSSNGTFLDGAGNPVVSITIAAGTTTGSFQYKDT